MKNTINFDEVVNRAGTHSSKWDNLASYGDFDTIAMYVADMDFKSPQCITDDLVERCKHGIFGYSNFGNNYFEAVINWQKNVHNVTVEEEEILPVSGVITGMYVALNALCKQGDDVIIMPPVYGPFFSTPASRGMNLLENRLINNNGYWEIDFDDFEMKAKQPNTTAFVLCNPHNPIGRVWTRKELIKLAGICKKNNVLMVVDEIHQDIIMPSIEYTSVGQLDMEFSQNAILLIAPSKTFNLPGLGASNMIVKDKEKREIVKAYMGKHHVVQPNLMGIYATIAAYNHGKEWLDEMLCYVDDNFIFMEEFIRANVPQIKFKKPQATYLGWLDFREINAHSTDTDKMLSQKAGVILGLGTSFGEYGDGFMRLTAACSRSVLEMALNRIKNIL